MNIKGLSIFAVFCLVIVLIIDFTTFKIPELIEGTAKRAETLIYTLCISYIASYIFYALNVYLKEKKERDSILPLIANDVILIIVNNQSIINALKQQAINSPLNDLPTQEEFRQLLKDVDPKKNAPMFYKTKPWTYLFQNRRENTLDKIDKIFSLGKHVDAQLRAILFKIQRTLFLREDYAFNSSSYEKDSLAEYSLVFYNYFKLIQELLAFYEKNLKKYYERGLPEKMHILTPIGDDKFKIETQYRKKNKQSL